MQPGDVLADRFTIEHLAGAGGMGAVYRARDGIDGGAVALKVMREVGVDTRRFVGEASVLADLVHPRVVRYLAHGITAAGDGWLAMEWLEGHDLAVRLATGSLGLAESLAVIRRAAEGLACAHERGIVHRDVKPSNLFLPAGAIDRLKVLDFGIARVSDARGPTRTGTVVGTPAYMAPEQARGSREVRPTADVFALGCVLFECITGQPPFGGDSVMAVLAKVLLEEAPLASSVRTGVPAAVDRLVAEMLEKDPARRPADGRAVIAAVDALGDLGTEPSRVGSRRPPHIGLAEQRIVCVVVAAPLGRADAMASTVALDDESTAVEAARSALGSLGARLEWLADGSVVVVVTGEGAAVDLASRAARCALAMQPVLGARPLMVATGRGVVEGRVPVGDVVDRAVSALISPRAPGIWLDQATTVLLEGRFDIDDDPTGPRLAGERERGETERRLLGKATRFVGREREIGTLLALREECVAESIARAALIVAPAGAGKTRLAAEVVRRVEASGAVEVVSGRGDPTSAGSPWALLGPAMRRTAGIAAGDPPDEQRATLERRLARTLAGDDLARVTGFLARVACAGAIEPSSAEVRAAASDPALLAEGIRASWLTWLHAETDRGPLLLALDDVQWADLPSIKLVDAALRALAGKPLFVLASARPEVHTAFPSLWAGRDVQEIRLGALTPRASERLVRAALGEGADAEVVASVIERAQGNAFFLEELVRAVASGGRTTLPDSVVGTIQARLDAVSPEARRVLRGASVFGLVFWRGGVTRLLGGEQRTTGVGEWLEDLERREIVVRHATSRVPGDVELSFQHALVRDAAYAMLPGADRELGHRLAAEWLALQPSSDPMVLAEHWQEGGDLARAAASFVDAARAALIASDPTATIERARRALACGASGALRGTARSLEAEALQAMSSNAEVLIAAREAIDLLEVGSPAYFGAATQAVMGAMRSGATETLEELARALLGVTPVAGADDARWYGLFTCARMLVHAGAQSAETFLDALDALPLDLEQLSPLTRATRLELQGRRAELHGDLGTALARLSAAHDGMAATGAAYLTDSFRCHVALIALEAGDGERADELSAAAVESTLRCGFGPIAYAIIARTKILLEMGRLAEAKAVLAKHDVALHEARTVGMFHYLHARLAAAKGDLAEAEREAREALASRGAARSARAQSLAALVDIHLARGEANEALAAARDAMSSLAGGRGPLGDDLRVHLAWIRALRASGDAVAADDAARAARDVVLARAGTLDERLRARYVASRVPAEILATSLH